MNVNGVSDLILLALTVIGVPIGYVILRTWARDTSNYPTEVD